MDGCVHEYMSNIKVTPLFFPDIKEKYKNMFDAKIYWQIQGSNNIDKEEVFF